MTTEYFQSFIELQYCYSAEYLSSTSDRNKLIIGCDFNASEDSISIINLTSTGSSEWSIYDIGIKTLPNNTHFATEYITVDSINKHANDGVAIFSLGIHITCLDASDVVKYNYGQPLSGNEYIFIANEGNPKYFDKLRVNQLELSDATLCVFSNSDILKYGTNLGRLKMLLGGEYGTFNKPYTFGTLCIILLWIENRLDSTTLICCTDTVNTSVLFLTFMFDVFL